MMILFFFHHRWTHYVENELCSRIFYTHTHAHTLARSTRTLCSVGTHSREYTAYTHKMVSIRIHMCIGWWVCERVGKSVATNECALVWVLNSIVAAYDQLLRLIIGKAWLPFCMSCFVSVHVRSSTAWLDICWWRSHLHMWLLLERFQWTNPVPTASRQHSSLVSAWQLNCLQFLNIFFCSYTYDRYG